MPNITEARQIEEMKKLPQDGGWIGGLGRERASVLGRMISGGCKWVEAKDAKGGGREYRLTKSGIKKLEKAA